MNTADRILAGVTALFLVAAGARLARSAETPRVIWPEIPTVSASPAPRPEARTDAAVQQALRGNLFSAARTAPATRFRVGMEAEAAMETMPAVEAPPPAEPPPPPPPPRYRVAGTMVSGTGGMALIDADPSSPAPEVYRQGDAVGGYRLHRIAYDHVVLVGATGEVRMDVAKPGETPRTAQAFGSQVPNAAPTPEVPMRQRARSSANTPPGAIPPGW
ncbi:MAG TPA: hypothetical protein VHG28_00245 [Longimicrobiaceae bacterium]|nr:hypothetical protein [Longimicrobiaceae bacterium]